MYLQTSRLVLRNFTDADLDVFWTYRNDPEVAKYQGWEFPYPRERAVDFVSSMRERVAPKQGGWIQFAVALKDTDELIGDLGCYVKKEDVRQAVIGFTIASKYRRKGYAAEIIPCLLEYLFEDMDMHRVTADCDADNIASYRALEKVGFRREAHYVESFFFKGAYASEYYYGMLRREWREKYRRR
ncbi:MAG: GNAT family N-acetyltransferase [Anaerolineales bacterium]|nr:GNAT family N-acetyltransferase [Anaerolineales bacterium]